MPHPQSLSLRAVGGGRTKVNIGLRLWGRGWPGRPYMVDMMGTVISGESPDDQWVRNGVGSS